MGLISSFFFQKIGEGKTFRYEEKLPYVRFIPESWNSNICMKVNIHAKNSDKKGTPKAVKKCFIDSSYVIIKGWYLTRCVWLCLKKIYLLPPFIFKTCFSTWFDKNGLQAESQAPQDPHPGYTLVNLPVGSPELIHTPGWREAWRE